MLLPWHSPYPMLYLPGRMNSVNILDLLPPTCDYCAVGASMLHLHFPLLLHLLLPAAPCCCCCCCHPC
jgi:hypothetical protein